MSGRGFGPGGSFFDVLVLHFDLRLEMKKRSERKRMQVQNSIASEVMIPSNHFLIYSSER